MCSTDRSVWLPGVLTGLLLIAAPVGAATPEVKDHAGYFSNQVVQKANAEIALIKKDFGKDLLIESFPEIPADRKADYDPKDPSKRSAFFVSWALERARAADIHGVYVLLCKSEGHLQIYIDPATEKKDFTLSNRNDLRNELLAKFKRKEFDEGLLEGVKYVRRTFQANIKKETATQPTPKSEPKSQPADSPFIRDRTEYFKSSAISTATGIIRDIKARHHREVQIDTFSHKPAEEASFADWARKLARARDLDGIQILLCRDPAHIDVFV